MQEYVSYHKIIQLIEDYQQSQVGIGLNSFGHGNLIEFGASPSGNTPTYPFLFATPISVSYDENITTWTIQLLFADRIQDDMSNEIDVISDMSIQAKRFMSYIKRGFAQTPDLYNKMDCNLPVTAQPFLERFNDFVGGVSLDIDIIVFEDINACDYYCDTYVTQYMEVILFESDKFRLALWNDSGFTSATTAQCNYIVSGTAYGSLGTIYTGTEIITSGQHQHLFNLGPVLQPGEIVDSFEVHSVSTPDCICPIMNIDFSPYTP